jgi:hypothetical protein
LAVFPESLESDYPSLFVVLVKSHENNVSSFVTSFFYEWPSRILAFYDGGLFQSQVIFIPQGMNASRKLVTGKILVAANSPR